MNIQVEDFIKDFLAKDRELPPLLVILGPTASGKTALSLEVAKKFTGEIISADSRQIYRHMDIGTDKIPVDKRGGIPHHLIDVAEPTERFTVADFKRLAEKTIDDILSRGKLPMLVGGTGLYIRAIVKNFAIPPENPEIKKRILEELARTGKENLHKKLKELDPEGAAKLHPNNVPYVVRALEILLATGKPKRDAKKQPRYDCLQIGLNPPREILFQRIDERVDSQITRGLIEEVKSLMKYRDCASMLTLGYREVIQYLDGKISLDTATELIKKNTRSFAKRQMTWFKSDTNVFWVNPS
ncbi:tRNA (adenosine(37)-N6)-dimethylallyltransferase MiaA [Candidatus Peregrinibacteria bacterium]|nr:tRNA (adenosine(37)-N6)-dimethylallyltransferase MiaA [Candidatus Peregrinibacteria bacterium]